MSKKWSVKGIMGTQVDTTAKEMERTMNKLEDEGYDVQPVLPFGGHFIMIGKHRKKRAKHDGRTD